MTATACSHLPVFASGHKDLASDLGIKIAVIQDAISVRFFEDGGIVCEVQAGVAFLIEMQSIFRYSPIQAFRDSARPRKLAVKEVDRSV